MSKLEISYGLGRPSLINYKVDTGADGSLLPLHDLCKVKQDMNLDSMAHTINPNVKLEAYTRNNIKQYSLVCLWLKYKDHQKQFRFYVMDRPVALLGLWDSIALNLITLNVHSI